MGHEDKRRDGEPLRLTVTPKRPRVDITGRPNEATDLSEAVIAVIGLWQSGVRRNADIARALTIDERLIELFVAALADSDDPSVIRAMGFGLPVGVSARLRGDSWVVCGGCGAKINRVPCLACSLDYLDDTVAPQYDDEPPPPTQPTEHAPGTAEKIGVMRQRLEQGVGLHHLMDGRPVR